MNLQNPFPGMNPWLENPVYWPGFHNLFIAAIANYLLDQLSDLYFVEVDSRAYFFPPDEDLLVGMPDIAVLREDQATYLISETVREQIEVKPLALEKNNFYYLEIQTADTQEVITAFELISRSNKRGEGRLNYLSKQAKLLGSQTHLIEIDLLRGGLPVHPRKAGFDYSIMISRSWDRPQAEVISFHVDQPLPTIRVPLQTQAEGDIELPLNKIFQTHFSRSRYNKRINYAQKPTPPLSPQQAQRAQKYLSP